MIFLKVGIFFSVSKKPEKTMTRIIIISCVFFALVGLAGASEFYECVDQDGNTFLTNNPPPDAKCSDAGDNESSSAESESAAGRRQKTAPDEKKSGSGNDVKRLIKIPRPSY
jgi:hypothetical protein